MQMLQRWRSLWILNNTVTQSTRLAAAAANLASYHSTSEKWKNKLNSSKIRFTVREKRPDPKRALKNVLYNAECPTSGRIAEDYTNMLNKKSRIKPQHLNKIAAQRKLKRKRPKEYQYEDYDDNPAKDFFASFAKEGFNSNFRRWGNFDSSNSRFNIQGARSMTCPNRKILGLPATGPLKIEDVKTAFRLSALKWHPDRHQRSARAAAEEQFKQCVDAYKSLCASVSSR